MSEWDCGGCQVIASVEVAGAPSGTDHQEVALPARLDFPIVDANGRQELAVSSRTKGRFWDVSSLMLHPTN